MQAYFEYTHECCLLSVVAHDVYLNVEGDILHCVKAVSCICIPKYSSEFHSIQEHLLLQSCVCVCLIDTQLDVVMKEKQNVI